MNAMIDSYWAPYSAGTWASNKALGWIQCGKAEDIWASNEAAV